MRPRYPLFWSFLALTAAIGIAGKATAEILNALLPDGLPGYDTDLGVTVTSRLHPDQMPLGLRDGPLVASPLLDESIGFNSNALPGPYRRGSWQIITAPSLGFTTDWGRNAIGALFSAQDTRTLALPAQSHTDNTESVGGRVDIGDGHVSLAAAHIDRHEDRGALDTFISDRPVAFHIDDVRATYGLTSGRWSIEPSMELSNWTYDPTTVFGVPTDQSYRDRIVVQGGVTLRYELSPLRDLLFVVHVLGQDYTHSAPGQISPDSVSYQMLAGLDYDDNSVWRWRLLAGGETRQFSSSAYRTQNNLIAEAGVTWSPSGMTTVAATLSRETDDAAEQGASGLAYTIARLTIDHEYLRDILLKASLGWQQSDFFQGGHQTALSAGAGLTWVLNRNMRLSFTYDQIDVSGSAALSGTASPGYSRGLGLVTMRVGL